MHILTSNPRVMTVYLPWLACALAGALELEGVHRVRRAMFGVHPIRPGIGWLLLSALGMAGATALSYILIYIDQHLHAPFAPGYWLPWSVCLGYLTVVAERERRSQRAARVAERVGEDD